MIYQISVLCGWLLGLFSIFSNKEGPRMLLLLPTENLKGFCCPPSFLHLLGNCGQAASFPNVVYIFYMHRVFFVVYLRVQYNNMYIPYFKIKCFFTKYKNAPCVKSYIFSIMLPFYVFVILLRLFWWILHSLLYSAYSKYALQKSVMFEKTYRKLL